MAENESSSSDPPITAEAVAENLGGAYWTVDECRWAGVSPSLSAELVDLLAPPIVVAVVPFPDDHPRLPAVPPEPTRPRRLAPVR